MSAVAVKKDNFVNAILRAVVIYDDFDAAMRATALLERVASRADPSVKWDIKPWKLEVLKQPSLAALTGAVAANADLVVLTFRRTYPLPPELLNWLRDWAQQRHIQDAAMLALAPDDNLSEEPWNELKTFAKGHGLIFLDKNHVAEGKNPALSEARWRPRPEFPQPPRAFARRLPNPSHWGINE